MGAMKKVTTDPQLKALYMGAEAESIEYDFCQECGASADRVEYDRIWCDRCWETFCVEYEEWLRSLPPGDEEMATMEEIIKENDSGHFTEGSA